MNWSGRWTRSGDGTEGFRAGEYVAVNPNLNCGHCAYCRVGRTLMCANLKGLGTNWPGSFAEYVVVPANLVFSVDGIDPDTSVFTEPTACAMHGLQTLSPPPGSSALVFGAGPTGLLLAQLIARGGAASVTVAASSAFKLQRAEELGIDRTFLMDRADLAGDAAALLAASGGFDVVVDATGAAAVSEQCVPLTRSGGTVMFYGVTEPEDLVRVSPYDVFRREITIKGSFAEIDSFPAAIAALRTGRARTDGPHHAPLQARRLRRRARRAARRPDGAQDHHRVLARVNAVARRGPRRRGGGLRPGT